MRLGAVTLAAALPLARQESPPAEPPAPPTRSSRALLPAPSPISIDRAGAPAAIALSFKLEEEGGSKLRIVIAEKGDGSSPRPLERHVLALDFDPFEGGRWSWSAGGEGAIRATLTQIPEPKDLEYRLRLVFPPERGLELRFADEIPILVARTPHARALTVSFESDGGVLALTAAATDAGGDARLISALIKSPPKDATAAAGAIVDDPGAWWIAELADGPAPELFAQHPEEELTAREGAVERTVLELVEEVRVPVLVLRPESRAEGRVALVIAGGRRGKAQPDALARIAELATGGALVAAADLLGCGERAQLQPYDTLESPEPLLIGRSPQQYAAIEARQLVAWMKQRADVGSAKVDLLLDAEAHAAFEAAGALRSAKLATPSRATASLALAEAAVFGEELVRPRYDSWFLNDLIEARETLPPPDRSIPLAQRIAPSGLPAVPEGDLHLERALAWSPSKGLRPLSEIASSARSGRIVLCASELGAAAALFAAVRSRPPADDEWLVGLDDAPRDVITPGRSMIETRVARIAAILARLPTPASGRFDLFGEGTSGVVMLLAATLNAGRVASVTTSESLPSFELLLHRPQEAPRAARALEVLTQGMPADLFVQDALTRFELEDCVLELQREGVQVDWRAPVDALRRPLSRHDRLALWPRVRHAERRP